MSRPSGQVRTGQAVLGMVGVIGGALAVVALCSWLLLPTEQLPSLEALQQAELDVPAEATCDDRLRAIRRRSNGRALLANSASLIECPATFDGRTVRYRGEAVGAALRRGDRAWLQLNDDPYALSIGPLPEHRQSVGGNAGLAVNVPVGVSASLAAVGDGRHRGDVMTVVGTFRATDPDDGGAPSIHATAVSDIAPGGPVAAPRSARRMVVAAALLAVTGGVVAARLRGDTR